MSLPSNLIVNAETTSNKLVSKNIKETYTVRPIRDPFAKYYITYNPNGGEGKSFSVGQLPDSPGVIGSGTRFSKKGYKFKNWNTKANGSGTTYEVGAEYNGGKSITLYAQWERLTLEELAAEDAEDGILQACLNPDILRVVWFFNILLDVARIVIPIGLIIIGTIDFSKSVISSDENAQKKNMTLFGKRLLYAVIIFLVPWIVKVLITSLGNLTAGVNFTDCIENANKESIKIIEDAIQNSMNKTS